MRLALNPNDTDKPIEVTRAEVSRVAKTGCATCHGAGYVVYAQKQERGQLVAPGHPGICRCVAKHFQGRPDVMEFDGKMHWMPLGTPVPLQRCGFRWTNDAGDKRICALPPHGAELDHLDESGARVPATAILIRTKQPAAEAAEGTTP